MRSQKTREWTPRRHQIRRANVASAIGDDTRAWRVTRRRQKSASHNPGPDILNKESESQSTENANSPEDLLGFDDGRLGEALAEVVVQMLQATEEVEGKGEAEGELEAALDEKGQASEGGGDAGALDVKTDEGGGDVRGHVDVEGAGKRAAGDSGPGGGAEPCLFDLVDAQVGGDGAVQSLVDENLLALRKAELVGGRGGTEKQRADRVSERRRRGKKGALAMRRDGN